MSGENKGVDFLLKIGDGAGSEVFTQIAGLQSKSISMNAEAVDVTNHGSNQWREILPEAGVKSASISAEGVFKDNATIAQIRTDWANQTIRNFQLVDGNADTITGGFKITAFEQSGAHNDAHKWTITLESSGALTFA